MKRNYIILLNLFILISGSFSNEFIINKNDTFYCNRTAYIEEYSYDLTDENGNIIESEERLNFKTMIDWENMYYVSVAYNNMQHPMHYYKHEFDSSGKLINSVYLENKYGITITKNKKYIYSPDYSNIIIETDYDKEKTQYQLKEEYGNSVIYIDYPDSTDKVVYEGKIQNLLETKKDLTFVTYSYTNNEIQSIFRFERKNNEVKVTLGMNDFSTSWKDFYENDLIVKSECNDRQSVYKYKFDKYGNWIVKDVFDIEKKFGQEILIPKKRYKRIIHYGNDNPIKIPVKIYNIFEDDDSEQTEKPIKNTDISLNSMNSIWTIRYYVDSFGDETDESYITFKNLINGMFSNTATENSELEVKFLITDKNNISIMLYEYGRYKVKSSYDTKDFSILIKDKNNSLYTLSGKMFDDRINLSKNDSNKLHELLIKNEELKFYITSDSNEYKFTISGNTDYSEIYKKLEGKN